MARTLKIYDMKKINASDIPRADFKSPKGIFELKRQHLSLALGGVKDQGTFGGGHPFDVELSELPPGKKNYPLHAHAAQWEYYIFLSGSGVMWNESDEPTEVIAGDHLICPPGDAHQLENTGDTPLQYFVIADHHPADVTRYPKTGKRHIKPEFRVVQTEDVDYFEGEE